MSKPCIGYKRYIFSFQALATILFLLLLAISIATLPEAQAEGLGPLIQPFTKRADEAAKTQMNVNFNTFRNGGTVVKMMLGLDDSRPPKVWLLSKNNEAIKVLTPLILKLLIPFYSIMIIISGTYYIWAGYSHVARARAKNMVIRLIVGMVLCGVSLYIYDATILLQNWVVATVITGAGVPITWNPLIDMPAKPIIAFFTVNLGCFGIPTWCALFSMIVMPFFILGMRNVLVVALGILFPLMIFLLSFRFTKGLGAYLLKMVLTWIFLPVPMTIFIVLSYKIGNMAAWNDWPLQFTAFTSWVMVAGAPMYMTALLGVAGGLFIQAGRTMSDSRMVTFGYMLYTQDPVGLVQGAYHSYLFRNMAQSSHETAKDWNDRLKSGGSVPIPPPYQSRLEDATAGSYLPTGMAKYDTRGLFDKGLGYTWGASLVERGKRALFGMEPKLDFIKPEDRWKYTSIEARHRKGFEDAWRSYGVLGLPEMGWHVGASLLGQSIRPSVAFAGKFIAGLTKNMIDRTIVGETLLKAANRMQGTYEYATGTDGKEHLVFRQGWSLGTAYSELKETVQTAYREKGGKGMPLPLKYGLTAGVGISLGIAVLSPIIIASAPALGLITLGGLVGTGVGASILSAAGGVGVGSAVYALKPRKRGTPHYVLGTGWTTPSPLHDAGGKPRTEPEGYEVNTVSGVNRYNRGLSDTLAVNFDDFKDKDDKWVIEAKDKAGLHLKKGTREHEEARQIIAKNTGEQQGKEEADYFLAASQDRDLNLVNKGRERWGDARDIIEHERAHKKLETLSESRKKAIWDGMSEEERREAVKHVFKNWGIPESDEKRIRDEYLTEALAIERRGRAAGGPEVSEDTQRAVKYAVEGVSELRSERRAKPAPEAEGQEPAPSVNAWSGRSRDAGRVKRVGNYLNELFAAEGSVNGREFTEEVKYKGGKFMVGDRVVDQQRIDDAKEVVRGDKKKEDRGYRTNRLSRYQHARLESGRVMMGRELGRPGLGGAFQVGEGQKAWRPAMEEGRPASGALRKRLKKPDGVAVDQAEKAASAPAAKPGGEEGRAGGRRTGMPEKMFTVGGDESTEQPVGEVVEEVEEQVDEEHLRTDAADEDAEAEAAKQRARQEKDRK